MQREIAEGLINAHAMLYEGLPEYVIRGTHFTELNGTYRSNNKPRPQIIVCVSWENLTTDVIDHLRQVFIDSFPNARNQVINANEIHVVVVFPDFDNTIHVELIDRLHTIVYQISDTVGAPLPDIWYRRRGRDLIENIPSPIVPEN